MPDHAFYHCVRLLSRPAFAVLFRLRREGLPRPVPDGAMILAANHVSYLDPAVVGSTFPRAVRFLMHHRVWRHWSLNWFYRGMEAIPVAREGSIARAALRDGIAALQDGQVVGIFPEGGRVDPGAASDGALFGVALLARRSRAPVVPIGILGTERAMPKGALIPRPVGLRVRYGTPLLYDECSKGLSGRAADEAFTQELMSRIRMLKEEGAA